MKFYDFVEILFHFLKLQSGSATTSQLDSCAERSRSIAENYYLCKCLETLHLLPFLRNIFRKM